MGFLKKIVKKVKKGIKKVGKGLKKTFKKFNLKKALKVIALVGAAVVTGGAAVGAFGGKLASSAVGKWLIGASSKILATPVVGTLAKPFAFAGKMIGTGAGKVTDFLGVTSEAGRLGPGYAQELALSTTAAPAGEINMGAMDFAGGSGTSMQFNPATGSYEMVQAPFIPGSNTLPVGATTQGAVTEEMRKQVASRYITDPLSDKMKEKVANTVFSQSGESQNLLGRLGRTLGFARDVASTYQQFQTPEYVGGGQTAGRETEYGIDMTPLQIAYAQSGVDLNDIYRNFTFGTGDIGYLASDLYRQQTIGVG